MYQCRIYKNIFPDNPKASQDIPAPVGLLYQCELPFPPYIGLEISDGSISCGDMKRVTWDVENKMFYCRLDDEYPTDIYETGDFNDLVKWSLEEGWVIVSCPEEYKDIFDTNLED